MFEIFGTTYYYSGGPLVVLLLLSPVAGLFFWLLSLIVKRMATTASVKVLARLLGVSIRAVSKSLIAMAGKSC